MDLLKRENWWIWLIINVFGQGVGIYILAAFVKAYDKDAWYAKWQYWLIGALCCFFPVAIMFAIFTIQIAVQTAKKLEVPGSEPHGAAYVWILCIIVPIFGWIALAIMQLYLHIYILVSLYRGNGEQYID